MFALTVCAVWLALENRWGSNFQLPTRYDYDAHLVLGMMRLAQQGDLGLFSHIYTNSLGAPFTGQLNDWPQAERAIVWLGGQIARVIGLMPAGEMATALESYGFAAVLLNRKGYEDRGEHLLAEFAKAGWPMEFEKGVDSEWGFIPLTPAENPILPTPTPYALTTQR